MYSQTTVTSRPTPRAIPPMARADTAISSADTFCRIRAETATKIRPAITGVIQTERLTKAYGPHRGIEDVDLEVRAGEVFGFLGPNGAGKTTLVRQLVGLLTPTSGDIRLFGEALEGRRVGATVAYLPQGSMALGEFRVWEAIEWTAVLRGCGKPTARTETEELLSDLELGSIKDRQLRKLSGGQPR